MTNVGDATNSKNTQNASNYCNGNFSNKTNPADASHSSNASNSVVNSGMELNTDCILDTNNITIVRPPDGGYGWIIVLVGFLFNTIIDGVATTFGVFLQPYMLHFNSSMAKTSLALSVLVGTYQAVGVIAAALINRYGCRFVAMIGSLIGTFAFFVSTFMPNIDLFIVFYGGIGGFGFGLVSLAGYVAVGYYFEEKRAFATGIACAGAGFGTLVMAPLSTKLLEIYDWRNAMYILAGLFLQTALLGALVRPLVAKDEVTGTYEGISGTTQSSDNVSSEKENTTSATKITFWKDINYENNVNIHASESKLTENTKLKQRKYLSLEECRILDAGENHDTICNHVNSLTYLPIKPLHRKDIFYSGNVSSIHGFTSHENVESYIASTMRKPHATEDNSKAATQCCFSYETQDIMKSLIDPTILKNPGYLLILLANLLIHFAYFIPYIYIGELTKSMDITETQYALILSIIGVSSIAGKISVGLLAMHPRISALVVNNVTLAIAGVSTIISPFCPNYAAICVYSAVLGFTESGFSPLTTTILVELLGLENLTNSFGFLVMIRGLAIVAGPPLSGLIIEATGSASSAFYFCGVLFVIAALLYTPLMCMKKNVPGLIN